ncbi:MAG TPA: response regulator [Acidobacteriota bacterium]|nr:response regulator [Acidobacteriota bacterium]
MLDGIHMHSHPDEQSSYPGPKRSSSQTGYQKFRFLADHLAQPVIEWEASLIITRMNAAAQTSFEERGTNWVGRSLTELISEPVESLKVRLSTTGSGWMEYRQGAGCKGHWSWVALKSATSESEGGIAIITSSAVDPEADLKPEPARFVPTRELCTVLDAIPANVALVDRFGIIQVVNEPWKNYARANNFKDDTLGLGWNYLEVCRQSQGSSMVAETAYVLLKSVLDEQSGPEELEYPCHSLSAKQWFSMIITPIKLEGQPSALVIHTDITEQKLAEQALRKSEARYRSLIAATAQSVWTTQANGQVVGDQPSWRALTGQSVADIQGWGWLEAIHPADREQLQQVWIYALETKSLLSVEHRVRIASGEYRSFAVRAVPMTDEAGKVDEWIGTHTDITDQKRALDELKKAETQLRHSQRMEAVGRLAGGVAHDFNNLLMVISGYADMVAKKLGKAHALYRFLEEIQQASRSASGVTRQLLAFSRKQDQQLKSLNLTDVVTQLHKLLRRVIGEDIKLVTSLADDTAPVLADPAQIEQVVLNLVVNARDAMPGGGTLTLQTENVVRTTEEQTLHFTVPPGNYVGLIVTDTGCGMDEAILERIYEPFFTTKEAHKGTGLGLSTVYGIVQQSNGYILVESQPGKGTRFTVLLPQTPGMDLHQATEEPVVPTDSSNTTILVVEDEDSVRIMVREVLTLWGYRVLEATSGEAAIKQMAHHHDQISLVLTDVVMSGMSGVNLVQHIRENHPAVKVLFMSGYIADASDAVGIASQLDNFISKPFTPLTLVKAIQTVLNESDK